MPLWCLAFAFMMLGVFSTCGRLNAFSWGFLTERNLNADYARRVVVGYSVSLISGMVRSRAWYQWAPQCPPSVFSTLVRILIPSTQLPGVTI